MPSALASWQVGDVTITRVREHVASLRPGFLLAGVTDEELAAHVDWLVPDFVDEQGKALLAFQAFVVSSQGRWIVVDTCLGNDRELPNGLGTMQTSFLSDLETIVPRERVDFVLCTHLHFDHVGWNTMHHEGNWIPTFPNARYLFSRTEYEHWHERDGEPIVRQGIDPVVEAGLHELVADDFRVTDEVRLEPTPGHTPGHVSVAITSNGARAVVTGDVLHHPAQIAEPAWSSTFDEDPPRAEATRRDFLARHEGPEVLVIGSHFAGPTAGRIVRRGGGRRLDCGTG